VATRVEKIRIVQTDEADSTAVRRGVERLARAVEDGSPAELALGLCALVPECVAPLRELPAKLSQRAHDARHADEAVIDDAIAARLA
jgi:hypothetical protein